MLMNYSVVPPMLQTIFLLVPLFVVPACAPIQIARALLVVACCCCLMQNLMRARLLNREKGKEGVNRGEDQTSFARSVDHPHERAPNEHEDEQEKDQEKGEKKKKIHSSKKTTRIKNQQSARRRSIRQKEEENRNEPRIVCCCCC